MGTTAVDGTVDDARAGAAAVVGTAAVVETAAVVAAAATVVGIGGASVAGDDAAPHAPATNARAARLTAADLPASCRSGCPVGPEDLRMLSLTYWGFDDRPHTGSMVVHASVATDVVEVFHRLYDHRFPIRRMEPVDVFGGSDD